MGRRICPYFEDRYDEIAYLELETAVWTHNISAELYYCKFCHKYVVLIFMHRKIIRKCFDSSDEAYKFFEKVVKEWIGMGEISVEVIELCKKLHSEVG